MEWFAIHERSRAAAPFFPVDKGGIMKIVQELKFDSH